MGATYTFNFADFTAAFPELAPVGSALATTYFGFAGGFLANDGSGLVQDPAEQQRLMLLLTAHITWLMAPRDPAGNPASSGVPAPNIVGRISSASQGSVSVSSEWQDGGGSPSAAWYLQSRYGALYWAQTAGYRTMRYLPNPTYVPPGGPFPLRRWWR